MNLQSTQTMVLILDGNSEIGAQVRSNLCYLIWLRHLIRSRAVKNRIFFIRKYVFSCVHNMFELPSNISKAPSPRRIPNWTSGRRSGRMPIDILQNIRPDTGYPTTDFKSPYIQSIPSLTILIYSSIC